MVTIYRLICRDNNNVRQYRGDAGARSIADQLCGRRCSAYVVIKSDEKGDRIIPIDQSNGDVAALEKMCIVG